MNRLDRKAVMASILSGLALVAFFLVTRASVVPNTNPLPSVTLKPLAAWTDDLVLQFGEPPSGWRLAGKTTYDEEGMPEPYFWFKNAPAEQAGATLSEGFVVYTTTTLAKQAYPRVRDKYFPPAYAADWQTMSELAIPHHADEMKTACLSEVKFNGDPYLGCRSIAQYQNVIVLVNGIVLPDRWLTLVDFRHMLEAVDRRVASVMSR